MMIKNNPEYKMIGALLKQPLESRTLRQAALEAGITYATAHKNLTRLLETGMVRERRKGKARLISVDFEHAPTDALCTAAIHVREAFKRHHPNIAVLANDLERALAGRFYTLILFGSRALDNEEQDSDVDLIIITPSRKLSEDYDATINKTLELSPLEADVKVVTTNDFEEMLNQKYSVGREAFENGIVLFGVEQYYATVKRHAQTKGL